MTTPHYTAMNVVQAPLPASGHGMTLLSQWCPWYIQFCQQGHLCSNCHSLRDINQNAYKHSIPQFFSKWPLNVAVFCFDNWCWSENAFIYVFIYAFMYVFVCLFVCKDSFRIYVTHLHWMKWPLWALPIQKEETEMTGLKSLSPGILLNNLLAGVTEVWETHSWGSLSHPEHALVFNPSEFSTPL